MRIDPREPPADTAATEPADDAALIVRATRWVVALGALSTLTGTSVALFLWALDRVTAIRLATPALLWFLPAAGALVAIAYERAGRGVNRGNNLIIDEIHTPGGGVPTRLAPLVLIGTLITHLFGGSAGREGTAVQMGGAIADGIDRHLLARIGRLRRFPVGDRAMLLQAGIAAGFGAVFGTPFAGAVFALEVLRVGRLAHAAAIPCLAAALLGDLVTRAWGVQHTAYPVIAADMPWIALALLVKIGAASIVFGLASRVFASATHALSAGLSRHMRTAWLRPMLGGACVIALTYAVGSRDYLGLGVSAPDVQAVTITSAFRDGGAAPWSWVTKGLYTVVTIGSGFKGGEVTPLFYIGATLGNTLAGLLHAPVGLLAALGFLAVFAGATNTPIACIIMGIELFGPRAAPYFVVACVLAVLVSGPTGVYTAQKGWRRAAPDVSAPPG